VTHPLTPPPQATLILYFIHAYVESDVSELGKLSQVDVWRLLSSFTSDIGAAAASGGHVFLQTLLPAIVMCIQEYLMSKHNVGTYSTGHGCRVTGMCKAGWKWCAPTCC
jgi:hypothetical protein